LAFPRFYLMLLTLIDGALLSQWTVQKSLK